MHWNRAHRHGDPLWGGTPPEEKLLTRLWRKVHRSSPAECWPWSATVSTNGYGQIRVAGRNLRPHRVLYEILNGPIEPGLDIDHLCHNADASCPGGWSCFHRRCCNPAHLEPVTRSENMLRGLNRHKVGS